MPSDSTLTWDNYLTLTLGDMTGGEKILPEYRGFMQMRLGDLRNFRTQSTAR